MKLGRIAAAAETHLNDLQADMEAGSRQLEHIYDSGSKIRESLFEKHMQQASLMGSLINQIAELRACVAQQRETMRELRHNIRDIRALGRRFEARRDARQVRRA